LLCFLPGRVAARQSSPALRWLAAALTLQFDAPRRRRQAGAALARGNHSAAGRGMVRLLC